MPVEALKNKANGAYLAAAWKEFIKSELGQDCLKMPILDVKYLENRLWHAFMHGADEAIKGSKYLTRSSEGIQ